MRHGAAQFVGCLSVYVYKGVWRYPRVDAWGQPTFLLFNDMQLNHSKYRHMTVSSSFISKANRNYLMGIAIMLVVFLHLSMLIPDERSIMPRILRFVFQNGSIGVNIFVFLSAYGLCFSLNNNNLKEFYLRRFKRIYPIYPIWIIIAYLYYDVRFNPFSFFLLQLTGIGLFIPQSPNNWYMEYITLIYILFPFIFGLLYHYSKYIIPCSYVIIFASLFVCMFVKNYDLTHAISRIPMLISGILVYVCEKKSKYNSLLMTLTVFAMLSICNFVRESFLFIPLVCIALSQVQKPLLYNTISFLGKYSIEIFLTHIFAIKLLFLTQYTFINIVLCCIGLVLFPFIAHCIQEWPYKTLIDKNCL